MELRVVRQQVVAVPLAVVRRPTSAVALGRDIRSSLDKVWAVLRGQGVATGQNVVVYHGGLHDVEFGVEVHGPFEETADVKRSNTPNGDAAAITHWGEYSAMKPAYQALERWCDDNECRPTGISWEVYGDWAEDPAKLRTDIYFLLEPGSVTERS